jgi:NAD(P)-dependent dehydrogenase (short-subunit alcohol dehydrogenase family)
VFICSRRDSAVESTVEDLRRAGGEADGMVCDVTDVAQIELLVKTVTDRLGSISVLVTMPAAVAGESPPNCRTNCGSMSSTSTSTAFSS